MRSIRQKSDALASEVTPEDVYLNRRRFLQGAVGVAAGFAGAALVTNGFADGIRSAGAAADDLRSELTSFEDITNYNNFYEFGTDKRDPARNAHTLRTEPWSVAVDGLVERPGTYDLDALLSGLPSEERIYRLRCVEGWSMVIPWEGVMLRDVIARLGPESGAEYVRFETLLDPESMPGQRRPILDWPYVEGLRLDEALHPLTLLATGLYGRPLPNQNGAPVRLVVPWKYGFKSIKSIVRMSFVAEQPRNSWNVAAPHEYGFYANVNPEVDHPRWSQARERRIGEWLRRPTLPFNGYADEVASLYAGMDLRVFY